MKLTRTLVLAAIALAPSLSTTASAASAPIAQWNFNKVSPAGSQQQPSLGSGTLSTRGGMTFLTSLSSDASGSPGDTTPTPETFNHSQGMNGTATAATSLAPAAASGSVGIRVVTSTHNKTDISVSWHQAQGFRGSRYYQLFATTDGTNYSPVPLGTGSTVANLGTAGGGSWYGSASVSNTGLVDIRVAGTGSTYILNTTGASMGYTFTYTFPSGSAFENNPNFGVQLMSIWESAAIGSGANDYVSSAVGATNLADATNGYVRNGLTTGGGLRYDLITVSGVPEPTALGTLALLAVATLRVRRRSSASE